MKRFWTTVARTDDNAIELDGRPVRTPARVPLRLPSVALADAVADEWRAVGERVDPRAMPLTGLANAAVDCVLRDPGAFTAGLVPYAATDVLCYRAAAPGNLVQRQSADWDPPLRWAEHQFGVRFTLTSGIAHVAQPAATVARLAAALSARDAFALAGLSPLITMSGSLIIALMIDAGALGAGAGFDAAHLDERWQAEQWSEDVVATAARSARRYDFVAAARFLDLMRSAVSIARP